MRRNYLSAWRLIFEAGLIDLRIDNEHERSSNERDPVDPHLWLEDCWMQLLLVLQGWCGSCFMLVLEIAPLLGWIEGTVIMNIKHKTVFQAQHAYMRIIHASTRVHTQFACKRTL